MLQSTFRRVLNRHITQAHGLKINKAFSLCAFRPHREATCGLLNNEGEGRDFPELPDPALLARTLHMAPVPAAGGQGRGFSLQDHRQQGHSLGASCGSGQVNMQLLLIPRTGTSYTLAIS